MIKDIIIHDVGRGREYCGGFSWSLWEVFGDFQLRVTVSRLASISAIPLAPKEDWNYIDCLMIGRRLAMKPCYLMFLVLFCPVYVNAIAQQCSAGLQDHFAGVNARGDQGMGFSHEKTTHHFHLLADGGAIEIQSNEPTDAATQEAVRQHLAMIAVRFSQGDFAIPMFIHATAPPGVETMKRLKGKITYDAEDTQRGAELRITTHDPEAIAAIHSFLSFQIRDHRTGDSLQVQK